MIEDVYEAPYLSHAPMEPMNCTADVRADGCDIWASTQMQTPSRDAAAQITGLPKDKVKVHTMFVGGGFGRRARTDFVSDAVEVSKAVNAPVKVTWSREDDIQHDWYRPASYVKMRAALDAEGWPTAFAANIACQPFPVVENLSRTAVQGFDDLRYKIPNMQFDYHVATTHLAVSYWRSVGHSQNGFFIESFIDELAAASGKDPVEFRRRLLADDKRLLGVLNLAAEKAGWGKPLPAGRFRGVAAINNIGSFNAQVAEISINQGKLRVHRVVCAVDCGHMVNPAIIRQQIEGGMVYGLAAALKGAITIDHGRVQQSNFDTYDVVRIDEMPQVEVHIVPSTEAPGGIGEASTPGIAPAIANAVFAATGKRIRKLPIRSADLV
jgi:isoquinoline 1-oxidoreductase beta subunit